MTEQEICDRQRENGNSEMYLRLSGTFRRQSIAGKQLHLRMGHYGISTARPGWPTSRKAE